jgi:Zn ribbon nucleic-acid-binding protein
VTAPKMKPCPDCGNTDLACWGYEWGWKHVECDKCDYLGPGLGSVTKAIRAHNAAIATEARRAGTVQQGPVHEGAGPQGHRPKPVNSQKAG